MYYSIDTWKNNHIYIYIFKNIKSIFSLQGKIRDLEHELQKSKVMPKKRGRKIISNNSDTAKLSMGKYKTKVNNSLLLYVYYHMWINIDRDKI